MKTLNVGVIGVGVLGRHHARLYGECENANLIGVYDASPERAQEIADEFGTKAFSDINELAELTDALSVAVPTNLHFEVVTMLLEKGKHVLVEKPIASDIPEGNKLVALAEEKGLLLGVGHVERFNPVLECLKKAPGKPQFIEAQRLAGYPPPRPGMHPRGTEVSVVHDLMIHDIDIILSMVESPVSSVDAVGVSILSPTVDIANVRLQFENGCVANLTASRVSQDPLRKIRVFKKSAYLSLDYGNHSGEMAMLSPKGISREPVPVKSTNALKDELEDFCTSVIARINGDSVEPRVSGRAGLKALEVAERIMQSISEHNDLLEQSE